ncbi:MAG TPA: flagellar basal body rod protein FlgC [Thermoanaerobacterales bacterium]|mgnify:CR=1 FL=1|jgi:flagellar basal-body rod protein FlgC|nr:flagellar basal body rod protein FlgC [Thermoanaerobacterales bacterium]
MGFFDTLNVSASGLTAQRLRLDVISDNIANVNTTRTSKGTPYRRKNVVFQERSKENNFKRLFSDAYSKNNSQGVRVISIKEDHITPFKKVYDPSHPDAKDGYVDMPNVNIVTEMVDMISATRSYEANITAINSTKNMVLKTLEIGK